MIQRISDLPAPALAGVVRESSVMGAIAEIRNCQFGGADMIDLHMHCLESSDVDSLKRIVQSSKLPILALNYGEICGSLSPEEFEEERINSFLRAVEAGASGVDIQGYTFHRPSKEEFLGEDKYSFTKGEPKEVVTDEKIISKQCDFINRVHSMGAEVLLSCHPGIPMKCEAVVELALFLEKRSPDIIKIVTIAESDEDLLESIKAMMTLKKEVKTPVSYHAGGGKGTLSRILNPVLGGHMAFCVDRYNERSTMEQLDLRTVRAVVDNMKKIL